MLEKAPESEPVDEYDGRGQAGDLTVANGSGQGRLSCRHTSFVPSARSLGKNKPRFLARPDEEPASCYDGRGAVQQHHGIVPRLRRNAHLAAVE